ncbi:MAG TPA: PAS-domain containing protein [Rhizomicrobium sp.]|nr:PAS-domain containing protein [Rhizomicrobium sp.]
MTMLVPFIQFVSQPLVSMTGAFAEALGVLDHRPPGEEESAAAAFAISAGLIGMFCIFWACWLHARLGNLRISMRLEQARSEAAALFRGALLNHGAQSILVLRSGEKEPQQFGEAHVLLHACKAGQDGPALTEALDSLVETGASFMLRARTAENRTLAIRGSSVGGRAVIYFQEEEKGTRDFREILDALPMPVWLHEDDRTLAWANAAFLQTFGVQIVEELPADMVEWAMPSAAAQSDGTPGEIRRQMVIAGERRTFALTLAPLHGTATTGVALDITAAARSETRLSLELDAQTDMMERIPTAVAVFDTDRRLVRYNHCYAKLWGLAEAWLDTHPSQEEILDRLRDGRKLPEQRNFAEWKQDQSQLFDGLKGLSESFWHLPGGKSLRVVAQPHLLGGLFFQFEDISEKLRLESAVRLLTQVQRATLDTIDDGIAIFGTDGRLVLHNSKFTKMWRLTEDELFLQPHFADIANLCTARIGRDGIWGIVSWGVNSANPESLSEWGKARRADGRLISLALSRLPNGTTIVTFSDLTDLERFNDEQNKAKLAGQQAQNYASA